MVLPLLPVEEVETSFYNLRATTDLVVKKKLRDLFFYFDDDWINTVSINMWNVSDCQHHTNNICEGRVNLYFALLYSIFFD